MRLSPAGEARGQEAGSQAWAGLADSAAPRVSAVAQPFREQDWDGPDEGPVAPALLDEP